MESAAKGCTKGAGVVREVALPAARAVAAFARGQYARAVDLAAPLRGGFWRLGGSRTQRDALDLMVLEAAIRAGRGRLAQAIVAERKARRAADAACPRAGRARWRAGRCGRARPGGRLNQLQGENAMPSIKIKDATIAYTDAGRGDTVLLVHGSASSRRMWQPLVDRLAARYRVVAPDLVGYGESTPWRQDLQATDFDVVATFARELGCPLHVVGHSYGGALALRAALASGKPRGEPRRSSSRRRSRSSTAAPTARRSPRSRRSRAAISSSSPKATSRPARRTSWATGSAPRPGAAMSPDTRARLTATMPKIASEFRLLFRDRDRYDPRRARVPTLLVRGTRTTLAARAVSDRLAATMPNADLLEIEDAGHMLTVTHAERVNEAIEAHLAQAEAETLFDEAA